MRFTRCRDANWLMVLDIEIGFAPGNHTARSGNDVRRLYLIAEFRYPTVDRDDARLD